MRRGGAESSPLQIFLLSSLAPKREKKKDGMFAKLMKTILVVDDEPKITQLVRDYLERAGFGVLGCCYRNSVRS